MHKNKRYGAASAKFAGTVAEFIAARDPLTILDYGAGKRRLREALGEALEGRELFEYDPGVPKLAEPPAGVFDLVVCIDVLEHIEPRCLSAVLAHIREKTGKLALMTVHTGPAGKFLSDGRNAHLIQKPREWWHARLRNHFRVVDTLEVNDTTFLAVCEV